MKQFLLLMAIIIFNVISIFGEPIKVVFTGGPGTGKTTLIKKLAEMGYVTVKEAARAHILKRQAQGDDMPWLNMKQFQIDIVHKEEALLAKKLPEAQKKEAKIMFLDRAIPDGLAYFEFNEKEAPEEIIKKSQDFRYDFVFVLDFLESYESTSVRREGKQDALRIHELLISVYKRLGYEVIRIPPFDDTDKDVSVMKRVDFVFKSLKARSVDL